MNILIFGATSGIGRELAKQYVSKGNKVTITGRRQEKLDTIEAENSRLYFTVHHDIRKTELLPNIIEHAHQKMGNIDLIIVNAGIGKLNKELDWTICESVIKTNIIGNARALTEAYKYFYTQKKGHLVNISSVASLLGNGMNPSYNATKAFQANFLEGLWMKSKHSKSTNINVTDIRPGFVDTKLAQGEGIFWVAALPKAGKQIIRAIEKKKKVAYITKRWRLVAFGMKILPNFLLKKF